MADQEQSIDSVFDSIRTFELKPGDVIALRVKGILTNEIAERFKADIVRLFPDNKCVVLDSGMDLSVVRPIEAKA